MKTSTQCSAVILVAIICAFVTGGSIDAQQVIVSSTRANSGEPARLVVTRSANFGINESVDLLIDGKTVALLGYNESYDAPLSAGKHVLAIKTDPNTYARETPKPITIAAEAGKTYTFTAVWPDPERAALVAN
jgi:hypothetical protein